MKGDLDGILIGQSAIGNPRIFTPHIPDSNELKETILRHLDLMIAYEYYYQSQKEKFDGTLTMPKEKDIDTIISTLSKPIVPSLVLHQGGFQNPLFQQAIVIAFRKHLFQYIK